jgi:selenocysteine-specific elongation factor
VLNPFAAKHRGKELAIARGYLNELSRPEKDAKLASFVRASDERGIRCLDITAATGWRSEVFDEAATKAKSSGALVEANGVLIASECFAQLCESVISELEQHHKREPLSRGMLRETLRERLFTRCLPELFGAVITRLENDSRVVSERETIRLCEHKLDLSEDELRLRNKLEELYLKAGLEAPSLEEVMKGAGLNPNQRSHGRKILQLLIDAGQLVRVQSDMFVHFSVIEELKAKLLKYAAAHEPDRLIDVAAFKDLTGVSRKYAIPLLEFLDRERVTRRAGDKRLILKFS